MFCVFMKNEHAIANIKKHPEKAMEWVEAEKSISHSWKNGKTLSSLWEEVTGEVWEACEDAPYEVII